MVSQRSARARESHCGTDLVSVARPLGLLPFFRFLACLPFAFAVRSRPFAPQPWRTSRPAVLSGSERSFLFPPFAETARGSVRAGPPPNPRTASTSFRVRSERTTTSTFPAESSPWSLWAGDLKESESLAERCFLAIASPVGPAISATASQHADAGLAADPSASRQRHSSLHSLQDLPGPCQANYQWKAVLNGLAVASGR